jgi:hypothetical protein
MMQKDAAGIIASPVAAEVTVRWLNTHTGGVWDPAYQQWVGGTKTYTTTAAVRALQYFVTDRDEDLLQFAFVKKGDCIFSFLPTAIDFTNRQEVTITDSDGAVWVPVMTPTKAFNEYMESRVGNTQLFQAMLTRMRQ